jgi:hypothetical protein
MGALNWLSAIRNPYSVVHDASPSAAAARNE